MYMDLNCILPIPQLAREASCSHAAQRSLVLSALRHVNKCLAPLVAIAKIGLMSCPPCMMTVKVARTILEAGPLPRRQYAWLRATTL